MSGPLPNGHDPAPAPTSASQSFTLDATKEIHFVVSSQNALTIIQILGEQKYNAIAPLIMDLMGQLRSQASLTPAGPS